MSIALKGDSDSPTHRAGRLAMRWWDVCKRAALGLRDDHGTLVAGGVAYMWFLAFFPGLLAGVLVYGLFNDPQDVQRQVSKYASGLPAEAQTLLVHQMRDIAGGSGGGLTLGLLISVEAAV